MSDLPEARDLFLGIREAVETTGLSSRSIQKLADEGSIKRGGRNEYSVMSLLKHFCSKRTVTRDLQELKAEKIAVETEGERLKNEMLTLDLKERDQSLVDANEVTKLFSDKVLAYRSKVLAMPARLSLELSGISDPLEIQDLLTRTLDEALRELATEPTEDSRA